MNLGPCALPSCSPPQSLHVPWCPQCLVTCCLGRLYLPFPFLLASPFPLCTSPEGCLPGLHWSSYRGPLGSGEAGLGGVEGRGFMD